MTAPASILATFVKPAARLATGDAVGAAASGFEAMLALLGAPLTTGEMKDAGPTGEAAAGDPPADDPADTPANESGASAAALAGWLGRPGEASWFAQTLGQASGQAASETLSSSGGQTAPPAAAAFASLTAPQAAGPDATGPVAVDARPAAGDVAVRVDALRPSAAGATASALPETTAVVGLETPATLPPAGKLQAGQDRPVPTGVVAGGLRPDGDHVQGVATRPPFRQTAAPDLGRRSGRGCNLGRARAVGAAAAGRGDAPDHRPDADCRRDHGGLDRRRFRHRRGKCRGRAGHPAPRPQGRAAQGRDWSGGRGEGGARFRQDRPRG